MSRISLSHRLFSLLPVLAALLIAWAMALPAFAAGQLPAYLQKVQPAELFEGADRFGEPTGEPPIAPVYRGAGLVGYAYLNSDVTSSVGYSGKPIHIIVGIDGEGVVRGFKLIDHKEPIVLIGIPPGQGGRRPSIRSSIKIWRGSLPAPSDRRRWILSAELP